MASVKQLRDALAKAVKDHGKGSPQSLAARGRLNDLLASQGKSVNRIKGEPVNGAGVGNDLTTADGTLAAQQDSQYVNETGPTGQATYNINPDGSVGRDVKLSDAEQAKLTGEQNWDLEIQRQIMDALGRSSAINGATVDTSGLTKIDPTKFDIMGVQSQMFGQKKTELLAKHEREKEQFGAQLLNRGIQPGSPRAAKELEQLGQRQKAEMATAEAESYGNAGTVAGAQNGLYDTALKQRGQEYQELYDARNQPFMDLANLSGASGYGRESAVNYPQFSPTQYVDAQGTALGFAGLASDSEIAKLNATTSMDVAKLNAKNQAEIARGNNAAALEAARLSRSGSGAPADNPEGEVDNLLGTSGRNPAGKNQLFGKARTNFSGRFF